MCLFLFSGFFFQDLTTLMSQGSFLFPCDTDLWFRTRINAVFTTTSVDNSFVQFGCFSNKWLISVYRTGLNNESWIDNLAAVCTWSLIINSEHYLFLTSYPPLHSGGSHSIACAAGLELVLWGGGETIQASLKWCWIPLLPEQPRSTDPARRT